MLITVALFLYSFFLRFGQLSTSFWNDEAHVALVARSLLQGSGGVPWWGYLPTGLYQLGMYYLVAPLQFVFGEAEASQRMVFVIIGSLIPAALYLFAKKYFSQRVALLASFMTALSVLEIAWSRQMRPYIVLQLLFIAYLYALAGKRYIIALIVATLATLFHTSAIVLIPLIAIAAPKKWRIFAGVGLLAIIAGYFLKVHELLYVIVNNASIELIRSHSAHYRFFYWGYIPLLITATAGIIVSIVRKHHRPIAVAVAVLTVSLHIMNIMRPGPLYVRYSLIIFPVIMLYASYALFSIPKKYGMQYMALALFAAWILLSGKFTLNPYPYYSINADVRENPLADYQQFFTRLNPIIEKNPRAVLIDAWFDRTYWYSKNRRLDYFITNESDHAKYDKASRIRFIRSLNELKGVVESNKQGIIIVEEWTSLASEEQKNWIKKNLDYKFTTCDTRLANEGWCLSAYTWNIK